MNTGLTRHKVCVSSSGTILLVGEELKFYSQISPDAIYPKNHELQCMSVHPDISTVKAIHCHPKNDIVALGFNNGIVQLADISLAKDYSLPILSEFTPNHARSCSTVSFSPSGNLLFSGFEKVRFDYGIYIFDSTSNESRITKAQLAMAEGVSSATWLSESLVVAGLGRWTRGFDIRGNLHH
jgi:WD40 repeat protein